MKNKKDFVTAYCWMYGSSKKRAAEVYLELLHQNDLASIDTVIECFRDNAHRSFYTD